MRFEESQNSMIKILSTWVRHINFYKFTSGVSFSVDIKADNVLIDWKDSQNGVIVGRVQLCDLEDAAYIAPWFHIVGKQAGNWMWRSPEAHARGPVDKLSDIFSFALVVSVSIYQFLDIGSGTHFNIVHLRGS
jgi:serine/threonine protein kinase